METLHKELKSRIDELREQAATETCRAAFHSTEAVKFGVFAREHEQRAKEYEALLAKLD